MAYITLTTDWGGDGLYTSSLKGKILSSCSNIDKVIEISNTIPVNNIWLACFILKTSYMNFPKGSIHLIGVRSDNSVEENHFFICFEKENHFFVGRNDGFWNLIFEDEPEKVYKLDYECNFKSFPEIDLFPAIIKDILSGNIFSGKLIHPFRQMPLLPSFFNNKIIGRIVFVDSHGNCVTNISKSFFYQTVMDKSFEILFPQSSEPITEISNSYEMHSLGDTIAIFGFHGFLEIALVYGKMYPHMILKDNSEIIINIL